MKENWLSQQQQRMKFSFFCRFHFICFTFSLSTEEEKSKSSACAPSMRAYITTTQQKHIQSFLLALERSHDTLFSLHLRMTGRGVGAKTTTKQHIWRCWLKTAEINNRERESEKRYEWHKNRICASGGETVGFLIQSKYKYQAKGFRIYHGGMKPPSRGWKGKGKSEPEWTNSLSFIFHAKSEMRCLIKYFRANKARREKHTHSAQNCVPKDLKTHSGEIFGEVLAGNI